MKRTYFLLAAAAILVTLAAGLALYPSLPDRVPTHWNAQGDANGYSGKLQAVLLMPGIMAALTLLFAAMPWLSPRQFEMNGSIARRPVYLQVMLLMLAFMLYVHLVMLAAAWGRHIHMAQAMLGGVCALFAALSPFLRNLRRNFYIGVRTPWTLASEPVWASTHRFAARTFLFAGVAGVVFALLPRPHAAMVTLAAGALAPVIYSLVYYKQLERRGEA